MWLLAKTMQSRYLTTILFLMNFGVGAVSQDTPSATPDRDSVTAGQAFHLKVRLIEPPSYQASLRAWFDFSPTPGTPSPKAPLQIQCGGTSQADNSEADLTCSVPIDEDSGTFNVEPQIQLGPPPGGARVREIPIQATSIRVTSVPDNNVYPTSAAAKISLDQKQILQKGAAKFDSLLDQMGTRVDLNAAETHAFKQYLALVTNMAIDSLQQTRAEYVAALPEGKEEPIFFEDFDRQLRAFVIEANAPAISSNTGSSNNRPQFLRVQLSNGASVIVRPSPLDGSMGPYLSTLVALLTNIRDAYRKIAETGSDSFTISLQSSPPGATISYRRVGEKYQDYTKPTDVAQANFPYAMWTFQFTLGTCVVVKYPNPYIETSPNLNVDMQNCTQK